MLQWLFQKKELMTTFDHKAYLDATGKLTTVGIPFKIKTFNAYASGGRTRGTVGTFGENIDNSTQYYIYVLKKDFDRAAYAINQRNF